MHPIQVMPAITNKIISEAICMSFPLVGNLSDRLLLGGPQKDSGQARMTILIHKCGFTYELLSK